MSFYDFCVAVFALASGVFMLTGVGLMLVDCYRDAKKQKESSKDD